MIKSIIIRQIMSYLYTKHSLLHHPYISSQIFTLFTISSYSCFQFITTQSTHHSIIGTKNHSHCLDIKICHYFEDKSVFMYNLVILSCHYLKDPENSHGAIKTFVDLYPHDLEEETFIKQPEGLWYKVTSTMC